LEASFPPANNTLPFPSKVAVAPVRATCKLPVTLKAPVEGLYSSAVAPDLTSTLPSVSVVAVGLHIVLVRLPVELNVPVEGLYSSALERQFGQKG
jgi:hypothetical protein